ncbi:helix-turn-helix domain-containing protein [Algicella marina]|uniref:Helix-turn-helix domain-containing protein n=1 Tax=Algicella marina TaxID=2683284 RepID=A0A6P1T124_9RHOB|nr:helix-turn-helix transcriptional regulator [Algicella marina]QHQ35343.1 helix-turn-helix domain-containing protein [Algicella marina]
MTTMARSLKDKLATLDPARRAVIEAEADRLHAEYLTLQELRRAKKLTQVQLAETLGVQQATVAKYERQSDLLLSTLTSYVRAMGGELKLMVEFPGKAPVALEGLGETEEPRRGRHACRQDQSRATVIP